MKIVRFLSAAGPRLGLVQDEDVHDLWLGAQCLGLSWAD